jgi:Flp pilus assembly pilin Flp
MRFLRDQRGQATTDYVALVALLAVLLAVGASVTSIGAPGVANAVLGQFRRALCLVGGGDCPIAPRAPCTVASTRDSRHFAVNLVLVRLDEDTVVLRERLSDGTIRLTLSERDGGGVEGGVGGKATIDVRGHEVGVDREARAGVQGVLGHGAVYYARDERAADELLEELRRPRAGGGPRASEVFYEGGVRGLGRVAGAGAHVVSGQLDGVASAMLGGRRDRRNGQVTVSLGAGASGAGLVSLVVGGGAGALDGQAVLGLTLDRHGRPAELTLSATGRVAGGASLPSGIADALQGAIPGTSSSSTSGRRWELGARVDLRDPAVAGAWQAFRRAPASVAAIRALGEALHSHATVDVRTYALDGTASGAGGSLALGVKLGGEYEHAVDRARLLAAARRPPFGLWEARVDCVAV